MESALESAPMQLSLSKKIGQRIDALLRDPLSQKIIRQWEAVARAAGTLDPKKIESVGRNAAMAGNAVNIVLSVITGSIGMHDWKTGTKTLAGLQNIPRRDSYADISVATQKRLGKRLMLASPFLLLVRPVAWATLLAGLAVKPIAERVSGVTHAMTHPSSYATS